MAETEKVGLFRVRDQEGRNLLLYPVTKMEAVQGLEEKITEIDYAIVNRSKTFFLEPKNWVDNQYTLDVTGYGWTSLSRLIPAAPMPETNVELASYISIATQSDTQVILQSSESITDPVVLTIMYGGEETNDYYYETDSWYETREDGLYKYDVDAGEWVIQNV